MCPIGLAEKAYWLPSRTDHLILLADEKSFRFAHPDCIGAAPVERELSSQPSGNCVAFGLKKRINHIL